MEACSEHSAHDRAIEQHDKRLDNHGAQLDKINETLSALREIEAQNKELLVRQEARIAALEAAPAKRWEHVTNYIITAIVALVIGLLAGQIGLN